MNRIREKTVNSKTSHLEYGPTTTDMRMSRLSHPRASLFAMTLLAVVFLLFGLFASAAEPAYAPAVNTIDGAMALFGDWVIGHTGITG